MLSESDCALREAEQLRKLDELSRGEIGVNDAVKLVRFTLKTANDEMSERTYSALKDYTWQCLRDTSPTQDYRAWYDLLKHASVLLRRRGAETFAMRLAGFSELVAHSIRFADLQPAGEVLQRKHVSQILKLIAQQQGAAKRSMISKDLKIEDANLSRVLTILCSHGLVRREKLGKEAIFSLTAMGREAVSDILRSGTSVEEVDAYPHPYARWGGGGDLLSCNTAFKALCEEFDLPADDIKTLKGWEGVLESRAVDRQADPLGAWELKFGDGRWLRVLVNTCGEVTSTAIENITPRK